MCPTVHCLNSHNHTPLAFTGRRPPPSTQSSRCLGIQLHEMPDSTWVVRCAFGGDGARPPLLVPCPVACLTRSGCPVLRSMTPVPGFPTSLFRRFWLSFFADACPLRLLPCSCCMMGDVAVDGCPLTCASVPFRQRTPKVYDQTSTSRDLTSTTQQVEHDMSITSALDRTLLKLA